MATLNKETLSNALHLLRCDVGFDRAILYSSHVQTALRPFVDLERRDARWKRACQQVPQGWGWIEMLNGIGNDLLQQRIMEETYVQPFITIERMNTSNLEMDLQRALLRGYVNMNWTNGALPSLAIKPPMIMTNNFA